jgi:hypothetical protein
MTTMPCFSSSLPCTKRPRQSSFMLAFGWKVLSTLDTRPPHPTLLSLLAPLLKGRNLSRRPAWCWKWLGLRLLSFVVRLYCHVFVLFCKFAFFGLPTYMPNLFFSHQRVRWSFGDTFRVDEKKTQVQNHHKISIGGLTIDGASSIFPTFFLQVWWTLCQSIQSRMSRLTKFSHLCISSIFSTCVLFALL